MFLEGYLINQPFSKRLFNNNNTIIIIIIHRESFDRNSLDQNCHFSVDRNFHNQLTKIFDAFQLIKKFNQLPKNNLQILAVD
jgi:hypothetical protein